MASEILKIQPFSNYPFRGSDIFSRCFWLSLTLKLSLSMKLDSIPSGGISSLYAV